MSKDYLISVIIPVYNSEKYIERCVESLFLQTLPNHLVEFIFIDDASSDSSVVILQSLIDRDKARQPHATLLQNKINLGVSAVRNIGLKNASGKYVAWADSDDWLELNMLQTLLDIAIKDDLDYVWCDHYVILPDDRLRINHDYSDRAQYLNDILSIKFNPVLWNGIIKRSFIEKSGIRFLEGSNISEDKNFLFKVIAKTERVRHIKIPMYHYFQNTTSLTSSSKSDLIYQDIANATDVITFIADENLSPRIIDPASIIYFKLFSKKNLLYSFHITDYKNWRGIFPEVNSKILSFAGYTKTYKIVGVICIWRLWIFIHLWLLLKRIRYGAIGIQYEM